MRRLFRIVSLFDRFGLIPNPAGVLLGLCLAFAAIIHGAPGLSQSIEQGVRQACVDARK